MSTKLRRRGAVAAALAVLAGMAVVAAAPQFGFGRTPTREALDRRGAQGFQPDRGRSGLGDPRQVPEAGCGQRQHQADGVGIPRFLPGLDPGDPFGTVLQAVPGEPPAPVCGASVRDS